MKKRGPIERKKKFLFSFYWPTFFHGFATETVKKRGPTERKKKIVKKRGPIERKKKIVKKRGPIERKKKIHGLSVFTY